MDYTLSVTNEDEEFTLYDIVVEDEVPEGLNIDTSNIMVHFGDPDSAVKLSRIPQGFLAEIRAEAGLHRKLPAARRDHLPVYPVHCNRGSGNCIGKYS